MRHDFSPKIGWKRLLPVTVSLVVLFGMTAVFANDWRKLNTREQDYPPVIDFTWTPLGEVDLREFRGFLSMKDDYGLDFTSYRMEIVELGKVYDMPIPGMMGKEYEAPISLSLLTVDPNIVGKTQLTFRFSVSDDRGQRAELERVVRLKPIMEENVLTTPEVSFDATASGVPIVESSAPGITVVTTPVQ